MEYNSVQEAHSGLLALRAVALAVVRRDPGRLAGGEAISFIELCINITCICMCMYVYVCICVYMYIYIYIYSCLFVWQKESLSPLSPPASHACGVGRASSAPAAHLVVRKSVKISGSRFGKCKRCCREPFVLRCQLIYQIKIVPESRLTFPESYAGNWPCGASNGAS